MEPVINIGDAAVNSFCNARAWSMPTMTNGPRRPCRMSALGVAQARKAVVRSAILMGGRRAFRRSPRAQRPHWQPAASTDHLPHGAEMTSSRRNAAIRARDSSLPAGRQRLPPDPLRLLRQIRIDALNHLREAATHRPVETSCRGVYLSLNLDFHTVALKPPQLGRSEQRPAHASPPGTGRDANVPEHHQVLPAFQHVDAGCRPGRDGGTSHAAFVEGAQQSPACDIELRGPQRRRLQRVVVFVQGARQRML